MVPVVDLSRRGARFAAAFAAQAAEVARSGHLLLGERTAAFEAEFAAWTGAPHACAVSSGASALQLALAGLGVGPGDEVIVPAFTAVPTAAAVCAVGAIPVFADVDPATACLAAGAADALRTSRTRAVIVVHLYGYPADLPDTDLPVVEDAAQAHGALGDPARSAATAYSFYPTKVLGGIGDGGAVVTCNAELDRAVRLRRVHGMTDASYVHDVISQNFRMSELEAAWLRLGLRELEGDLTRRRRIATTLRDAAPNLRWQATDERHAYHLCVLRTTRREVMRARLAEAGVGTAVHYPLSLADQPAYAEFVTVAVPHAKAWARECMSVPCFPEMTDAEIDTVALALADLPPEDDG